MAALTAASESNVHHIQGDLLTYKCGASVVIYKGGFVGLSPDGYAKPFVPCDRFVGIAYESVTASATAGASSVRVYYEGTFNATLTATLVDIGKPCFATTDGDLAVSGHPDAFVGRIIGYVSSTVMTIRLRELFETLPNGAAENVYDYRWSGANQIIAFVKALTGTAHVGWQFHTVASGGAPTAIYDPTLGETKFTPGATSEVANIGIYSPTVFNLTKGVTFDLIGRHAAVTVAATDKIDFGLACLAASGMTATERADPQVVTTTGYTRVGYEILSDALTAYAYSGSAATIVGPSTITFPNILATNQRWEIHCRPGGACEFWTGSVVAGVETMVRRLSSNTTIVMPATGICQAHFTVVKNAATTNLVEGRIKSLRAAGSLA